MTGTVEFPTRAVTILSRVFTAADACASQRSRRRAFPSLVKNLRYSPTRTRWQWDFRESRTPPDGYSSRINKHNSRSESWNGIRQNRPPYVSPILRSTVLRDDFKRTPLNLISLDARGTQCSIKK